MSREKDFSRIRAVLQTQHSPINSGFFYWILSLYSPRMPSKSKTHVSPLETVNVKAAEAPAFPNTRSTLFELPLELIMEILSHLRVDYLPITISKKPKGYHRFGNGRRVSSRYLGRTGAIRALSQTCRSWRNLFSSLLWERLELHSNSGKLSDNNADLLMRMSAFVCESPAIALHVRCVQIRTLCAG